MMNMAANTEFNNRALFWGQSPLNICVPTFFAATQEKLFTLPFKTDTCNAQSMHSLYVYSGNTLLFKGSVKSYVVICFAWLRDRLTAWIITTTSYKKVTALKDLWLRHLLTISSDSLAGSTSGSTGTWKIGFPFATFTAATASNSIMLLTSMLEAFS